MRLMDLITLLKKYKLLGEKTGTQEPKVLFNFQILSFQNMSIQQNQLYFSLFFNSAQSIFLIVRVTTIQIETEFYAEVAETWLAAFGADRPHLLPYLEQFAAASGFYVFSSGERPLPWRLMGLNSNLWYKSNSFTQGMDDPADQFK
jgi:hypothetical protein